MRSPSWAAWVWTRWCSFGTRRAWLARWPRETSASAGRGYVRFLGVGGLILAGVVLPPGLRRPHADQDDPTIFHNASVTALALVFARSSGWPRGPSSPSCVRGGSAAPS
ncbi:MAG: hypothetical protein R2854_15250 [Caldilineaceae bacterium]